QGDYVRSWRQGCPETLALLRERLLDVAALACAERDLCQLESIFASEACSILPDGFIDPARQAGSGSNETQTHEKSSTGCERSFVASCTHVPQVLEPIELAHTRQHDVHDHILEIDEHPLPVAL